MLAVMIMSCFTFSDVLYGTHRKAGSWGMEHRYTPREARLGPGGWNSDTHPGRPVWVLGDGTQIHTQGGPSGSWVMELRYTPREARLGSG